MSKSPKVDVIVDLQFGSTGKGAIAGYLADKNFYDVVISANMPNAGHTFIDRDGHKMVHKVLPSGVTKSHPVTLLVAPGAVFSIDRLYDELDSLLDMGYNEVSVGIHEHASVLLDGDIASERSPALGYSNIGSTQQGSAEAMMNKLRRSLHYKVLATHYKEYIESKDRIKVFSHNKYINTLYQAKSILAEGAQGYSLGLNAGFWPYCTSRDCTPARVLADMLIPISWVREVIGTCRTYPIRVGGTSGPGYRDQNELTWDQVGVAPEMTTVTNRERRVFSFSHRQIWEAILICQPTEIFVNFCNYMEGKPNEFHKIVDRIDEYARMHTERGYSRYFGWGPTIRDIIDAGPKIAIELRSPLDNSSIA